MFDFEDIDFDRHYLSKDGNVLVEQLLRELLQVSSLFLGMVVRALEQKFVAEEEGLQRVLTEVGIDLEEMQKKLPSNIGLQQEEADQVMLAAVLMKLLRFLKEDGEDPDVPGLN